MIRRSRHGQRLALVIVWLTWGCAPAGPPAGVTSDPVASDSTVPAPLPTGLFEPDDRVLIGDFQRVAAVARSPRRLYAAAYSGLLTRDLSFDRWELPMTIEDGYPVGRATALVHDPREAVLWLATNDATLLKVDPERKQVLDEWRIDISVSSLVPGPGTGSALYGRTAGGWIEFDTFSRSSRPVDARTVGAAIEADPYLESRRRVLADPQFEASRPELGWRGDRRYAVSDLAAGLREGEVWVATDGGGLELLDLYGARPRAIPYGPVGRGSADVLIRDEDVWFAPEVGLDRYGLARADTRLQEWQVWDDTGSRLDEGEPPDLPVTTLVRSGTVLWAGSAATLHWFDGERWARQFLGSASRDDRVTALQPATSLDVDAAGGVWVGTIGGLLRVVRPGGPAERVSSGILRVRSLAVSGNVLWVGSDRGLLTVTESRGQLELRNDESAGTPLGPVNALAAESSVLYAAVGGDVWVRREGSWRRARPLGARRGPIESLAVRSGVLWIGADEGVTIWDTRSDRVVFLGFAAGDLPLSVFGERGVRDISLAADGTAWLATPAGALRIAPDS